MASVGLILNPEQKVFGSNGSIDQSATINFYTSGASSVRQKVYHDKDSEVPHGNPISYSDLNGSAVIYGDTTITYRQVTVSGTGSTLSTVDAVIPIMPREQLSRAMDVSTYSIVSDSGVNIPLAPGGTGQLVLDGLYFPNQDGTANYVLGTRGNGTLYWRPNGIILSFDTAPMLGGDLDANLFSVLFDAGSGIKDQNGNEVFYFYTTSSATNYIKLTNASTGNAPVVLASGDDSNIGINISGKGTGAVKLSGLSYPISDGTTGQALSTSGGGTVQFITLSQKLLQRSVTTVTPSSALTIKIPDDDTIPQITEGRQVESISFTPLSALSTIRISVCVRGVYSLALFNTASASALAAAMNVGKEEVCLTYSEPSASTETRTYTLRVGSRNVDSNPTLPWGIQTSADYGGVAKEYIIIDEYL